MVTVEQLYKNFGVLADAKDKAGEHEDEFKSILSAVKGGSSEKRLASQFIARFFKHFPGLALKAIDAQLDLCEDEDIAIRKQAIKDLPSFCRETKEHLPRIADVLTQLLQSEDLSELGIVHGSLIALFKIDAKGALGGLFSQILSGDDAVRERAIKFMSTKMKNLPEESMTKDVEDYLVTEAKKVLQDVTGDEFVAFMKILSPLKNMNTLKGRQQLVDIVTEQADLKQPFEPSDPDSVDRLVQCIKQAMPFFSRNVHSTQFVGYMCDNVLPVLSEVTSEEMTSDGATASGVDIQLELLKLLAEMSAYCGDGLGDNTEQRLTKLYNKLLDYMPLPPAEGEGENGENTMPNEAPKLQFSYVECLMYAFHQLAAKYPEFLAGEENTDRLKDFRLRLQYFARGVQVYIKQLRVALQGKTGEDLKTDENKIKVVALKITNNINVLIKDLFHNPPSYKAAITVSWRPVSAKATTTQPSPGQKRPGYTPITFDSDSPASKKVSKQEPRKLYAPPTGRWSDNAGTYQGCNRGRGFRGRGSFRGQGRGRGWRRGNRW